MRRVILSQGLMFISKQIKKSDIELRLRVFFLNRKPGPDELNVS